MEQHSKAIDQNILRHCQQILADNGIEADETATVLQALCEALGHGDVSEQLDWDFAISDHKNPGVPMPGLSDPRTFEIETPHGTLKVHDKKDTEYPGVWVDLVQTDGYDITLAMVEYIPGGESLSDYDPWQPAEMRRQADEVPMERRENGEVTAGFVTRSWPDEVHNEEHHLRTFHKGYPIPREKEKTLEEKVADAQDRAGTQQDQAQRREEEISH